MTPGVTLGVLSALALVLGLIFLALRLLKNLPGLARGVSEGPDLRVLGRAGLGPRQGVATVKVGGRTLLVGYGEGGVRFLADASEEARVPAGETRPRVDGPPSRSQSVETGAAPGGSLPFPRALAQAIRRSVAVVAALAALGAAGPAPVAAAVQAPGAAVQEVQGPEAPAAPTAPGVDFPSLEVRMGDGADDDLTLEGPVGTVLFVGFLTLIPTLLLLMTSFTRILVVLQLLKQAIGTQTAPPGHLLTAMALLLTGFVMAPTLTEANETAVRPWMDGRIDELQMLDSASVPFRQFMLGSVRETDLEAFIEMRQAPPPETVEEVPMVVLASAFVTSELRAAFQMGFALFLPFVVIDIVVASVLMSMGMFMLPPVMISLPFKLLLFVMVDGWSLVMGSLVRSFA